jgi:hypothetical protein
MVITPHVWILPVRPDLILHLSAPACLKYFSAAKLLSINPHQLFIISQSSNMFKYADNVISVSR